MNNTSKFKIKIIYIVIATVLILFSGCDRGPEKITEPLDIISLQYEESLAKEDTVLVEYDIKFPQIKEPGSHQGLIAINDFYKEKFNDMTEVTYEEAKKLAEEDLADAVEAGYEFRPHGLGNNYDVTHNDNGLLSIVTTEYTYWGGAHPNAFRESALFDVNSGQKLTLEKLFDTDAKTAFDMTLDEVKNDIEIREAEELLFEDALEDIENLCYEGDFYYDGENLVIYFQQYAIAPYAAGFPEFKIPIEKVPYFQSK